MEETSSNNIYAFTFMYRWAQKPNVGIVTGNPAAEGTN